MKKILFFATIHKHFNAFHVPYIKWFKEHGYEVHVAANGMEGVPVPYADKQFEICVERNPFKLANIKACFQLRKLIEQEHYELVTCHTAMGGVIARLAGKEARKKWGMKMLYTAHGFHFFKGSPKKYWMMYYPMEKFLSRYTDAIITINHEDYEMVLSHGFKNKQTFIIPGIGINPERLFVADKDKKMSLRKEYGYKENEFLLIYIAEYIPRKNHKFLIDALPELVKSIPNVKYLFAGRGRDMELTKAYANEKGVADHIDFLGFRKDIGNLIALSDVGISASRQEGLGLNIAEEMFSGKPVVASMDRGHKEMIIHGENGYLFEQGNKEQFLMSLTSLYNDPNRMEKMGANALATIQKFRLENSLKEMEKIYNQFLRP